MIWCVWDRFVVCDQSESREMIYGTADFVQMASDNTSLDTWIF